MIGCPTGCLWALLRLLTPQSCFVLPTTLTLLHFQVLPALIQVHSTQIQVLPALTKVHPTLIQVLPTLAQVHPTQMQVLPTLIKVLPAIIQVLRVHAAQSAPISQFAPG